jgi:predicted ATPase
VTFRPEFDPPWIGRPYVTALTINRLAEREAGAMIDRLVGNKLIPANIRQDIIERTDGIPLFIEEMTKAVLEANSQRAAERTVAAAPSPGVAVPASLHASLMARLDRLGPAKEVAQIGAAIGRELSHALLAAVVRKPEPELASALDRLIGAGLLFRQGVPPYATYLFMRWCRPPPMARYCASGDGRFTPESRKRSKSNLPRLPRDWSSGFDVCTGPLNLYLHPYLMQVLRCGGRAHR